jgi:hypothetical protein
MANFHEVNWPHFAQSLRRIGGFAKGLSLHSPMDSGLPTLGFFEPLFRSVLRFVTSLALGRRHASGRREDS